MLRVSTLHLRVATIGKVVIVSLWKNRYHDGAGGHYDDIGPTSGGSSPST